MFDALGPAPSRVVHPPFAGERRGVEQVLAVHVDDRIVPAARLVRRRQGPGRPCVPELRVCDAGSTRMFLTTRPSGPPRPVIPCARTPPRLHPIGLPRAAKPRARGARRLDVSCSWHHPEERTVSQAGPDSPLCHLREGPGVLKECKRQGAAWLLTADGPPDADWPRTPSTRVFIPRDLTARTR
jgi:hypothetical protein